jgi:hypothetical protein
MRIRIPGSTHVHGYLPYGETTLCGQRLGSRWRSVADDVECVACLEQALRNREAIDNILAFLGQRS